MLGVGSLASKFDCRGFALGIRFPSFVAKLTTIVAPIESDERSNGIEHALAESSRNQLYRAGTQGVGRELVLTWFRHPF